MDDHVAFARNLIEQATRPPPMPRPRSGDDGGRIVGDPRVLARRRRLGRLRDEARIARGRWRRALRLLVIGSALPPLLGWALALRHAQTPWTGFALGVACAGLALPWACSRVARVRARACSAVRRLRRAWRDDAGQR